MSPTDSHEPGHAPDAVTPGDAATAVDRTASADQGGTAARAGNRRAVRAGLRRGLAGGLAATVTMTVYRLPVFRALPPTAEFWARFVAGGEPADHPLAGLALHLGYGGAAGAVFGAVFSLVPTRDWLRRELAGVVLGAVYSLVLSAFGARVLLGRLLDLHPDPDERVAFHVGHLVYGLTLGTWVGVRASAGRDSPDSELDPTDPESGPPSR